MNTKNLKVQTNSNEISLKDVIINLQLWVSYLLSKWLLLIFFGLLGGIIGFGYAYTKKTKYIAATTFVLEDDKGSGGGLGSLAGIASIAGVDIGGGGGGIFQGDNILELYKSRSMIQKTLLTKVKFESVNESLIDRYIRFKELKKSWEGKPSLKDISFSGKLPFTRVQDSILGVIVGEINKDYLRVTKLDKKLSIIKAEVIAEDEQFAKAFDEEIVKNVNDFYVQTRTKKSLENTRILDQKVDSVRTVMNGAIYNAAAVADATPNLNITRQAQRAAPIQRSQFSAETNKAILSELIRNLELSRISLRKETPLIQVIDEPVYPLYRDKTSKIKYAIIGSMILAFAAGLILIMRRGLKKILA